MKERIVWTPGVYIHDLEDLEPREPGGLEPPKQGWTGPEHLEDLNLKSEGSEPTPLEDLSLTPLTDPTPGASDESEPQHLEHLVNLNPNTWNSWLT